MLTNPISVLNETVGKLWTEGKKTRSCEQKAKRLDKETIDIERLDKETKKTTQEAYLCVQS